MAKGGTAMATVSGVNLSQNMPIASVAQLPPSSECCSVVAIQTHPAQAPPAHSHAQPTLAIAPAPAGVLGPVGSVQVTLSEAIPMPAIDMNQMGSQTSMAQSIAPTVVHSMAQRLPISAASGHLVTYPLMTQPPLRQ